MKERWYEWDVISLYLALHELIRFIVVHLLHNEHYRCTM